LYSEVSYLSAEEYQKEGRGGETVEKKISGYVPVLNVDQSMNFLKAQYSILHSVKITIN
jgi:hypothetical protein